jgi:hypothetical protein
LKSSFHYINEKTEKRKKKEWENRKNEKYKGKYMPIEKVIWATFFCIVKIDKFARGEDKTSLSEGWGSGSCFWN